MRDDLDDARDSVGAAGFHGGASAIDLDDALRDILRAPCRVTALEHLLHRAWAAGHTGRGNPYAEPVCLHCDGDGYVLGTTSDPSRLDPPEEPCPECRRQAEERL